MIVFTSTLSRSRGSSGHAMLCSPTQADSRVDSVVSGGRVSLLTFRRPVGAQSFVQGPDQSKIISVKDRGLVLLVFCRECDKEGL